MTTLSNTATALKLIGTDSSRYYAFVLAPGTYIVGRSSDCEFSITDKTVSRRHAEILVETGGNIWITELGSHNGTIINGHTLAASQKIQLKNGDQIAFGQTDFRIVKEEGTQSPTLRTAKLADRDPEKSVYVSLNEMLKPLPARLTDNSEVLSTVMDFAKMLVLPEPREQMLKRALEMVSKVIPAERLAVLFISEDQENISTGATLLTSKKDMGSFTLSRTIIKDLLANKSAILIGDPHDDSRYAQQQSIIMSDLRSAMAVPLFDESRVLGILYVDTTSPLHRYTDDHLRLLATFANIVGSRLVNSVLLAEREEKQALEVEIKRAASIQKNLLTIQFPPLTGWEVFAVQKPSRAVGGDLYDTAILPDGRLVFLVADVSGKGMGAALLMSNILASFRALYSSGEFSLEPIVTQVSMQLWKYSVPEDFATLFIGMVEPGGATLHYINAGHNPPALLRTDGTVEYLPPSGTMIGAFNFSTWSEAHCDMVAGDWLYMFSDGVTEATRGEEQFSDARLEKLLLANRKLEPQALAKAVMDELDAFVGDAPRSDDITMMILRKA